MTQFFSGFKRVLASAVLFATLSVAGIWYYAAPGLAVALLLTGIAHLVLVLARCQKLDRRIVVVQYGLVTIGGLSIVLHLLRELGPVTGFSNYLPSVPGGWLDGRAYRGFLGYLMVVSFLVAVVTAITTHIRLRRWPSLSEVVLALFTANTLSFTCEFAIRRLTLHVYVYDPAERDAFGFFVGLATLEFAIAFHLMILAMLFTSQLVHLGKYAGPSVRAFCAIAHKGGGKTSGRRPQGQ